MNENTTWGRRIALVVAVCVSVSGWLAPTASAREGKRCRVAGFTVPADGRTWHSPYNGDTDSIRAEWTSEQTTTITCGSRIISVDVWEHAYGVQAKERRPGDDTIDIIVTGLYSSRLTGDFDGDGSDSVVSFDGRVSGEGSIRDDVLSFRFTGRGSDGDGSRVKLHHRGTVDLRADEWRHLEVTRGVFNPVNVSFTP